MLIMSDIVTAISANWEKGNINIDDTNAVRNAAIIALINVLFLIRANHAPIQMNSPATMKRIISKTIVLTKSLVRKPIADSRTII